MKLKLRRFDLELRHHWTISRDLSSGVDGGIDFFGVVFIELWDGAGLVGLGEAAPSARYNETPEEVVSFLGQVDLEKLSFEDVEGSMAYVNVLSPKNWAAKGSINLALLDGAAKRAGKAVYDYLGLGFTENKHVTSFSIGIDRPERVGAKVLAAAEYPVLKLKLGSEYDRQNLAALREVAPQKPVRVDANEAWQTPEQALRELEWLAADGNIQFVEQPMPATTPLKDFVALSRRSPLPLMADESCHFAQDIPRCTEWAKLVNVKLVKAGGISGAFEVLKAARQAGLKTMIGCMIESSLLISAGAQLAELSDCLDLDGNLLVKNDPFSGASARNGILSFAAAPEKHGLRACARA